MTDIEKVVPIVWNVDDEIEWIAEKIRGAVIEDWCDVIKAWIETPAIRAHILREAWPAIPTEAMLNAVAPFPEHLRAEHPDPNDPWHNAMQGATLADQAYLQQVYRKMRDVALLPLPPTGGSGNG